MVNKIYTNNVNSKLLVDPIDIHQALKRKDLEVASNGKPILTESSSIGLNSAPLDLSDFKFAAKAYHINPNIKDYVLVPVIIMPASMPNRNGVGFYLKDLVHFSTDHGKCLYKTWKGKPTFYEHDNQDVTKAKGIILDVILRKSTSENPYWKIINYLAYDRSKDEQLVRRILNNDITTYSMGAYVQGGYECSYCNKPYGHCTHLNQSNNKINLIKNRENELEVAFKVGRYPVGFETSAVEVPAYSIAENDAVQFFI